MLCAPCWPVIVARRCATDQQLNRGRRGMRPRSIAIRQWRRRNRLLAGRSRMIGERAKTAELEREV